MCEEDYTDYTVKSLIEELKEYPEDTPIWFMFKHSTGIMSLFDVKSIGMFTLADSEFIHFVLENSSIYKEKERCQTYGDELTKLHITNRELKNQISKLTSFIIDKGYNLDDYANFLANEWKKE